MSWYYTIELSEIHVQYFKFELGIRIQNHGQIRYYNNNNNIRFS